MNRSRMAFALVAPLLTLVGCSDDPVPKVAPHESPSATAVSGTKKPRLDPVETAEAWVEAQNVALHTGDTTALRQLSADPCESCDGFIDPIEQVYKNGGVFKTRGWTVEGAKARSRTGEPIVIDAAITIAGGKTMREDGAEPVIYKAEKHIMVFKVVSDGRGWAVSFIGFIS